MATDYDAPRKNDDEAESIEALKERVPDKMSGGGDGEDEEKFLEKRQHVVELPRYGNAESQRREVDVSQVSGAAGRFPRRV